MRILQYAGVALIGATIMAGCSSSNDAAAPPPTVTPPTTSTPLPAQSATLSIADPAGTAPVATVTTITDSVIGLTATVTTPGSGGAGTIDIVLSGTNNADRAITNFKAIADTSSTTTDLGTATITGSTGTVQNNSVTPAPLNGERFVYLGEPLVTPPGKTVEAIDAFTVTLNATTVDPLVIQLALPTEDVALITTDDYSGEEEIIAIDTGVGGNRVIGNTGAYVYVDFDDDSSYAANATEGFLSADGRYAYVGHKTNPYVMVVDLYQGTVDAFALLPPPDEPYPSGQAARIASVSALTPSPDGKYFYAAMLDGTHPYGADGCAYDDANGVLIKNRIIKVDISTMDVVGDLDVTPPGSILCADSSVMKRIGISADGSVGAAALYNKDRVVIVNLDDMTLMKSVIVNGVADDKDEPHYTAPNADGSKVYVAYNSNNSGLLDVIDTSDFSISELPMTADLGTSDAADLRFGPDGRLYFMRRDSTEQMIIYDFSTDPATEVVIDDTYLGVDFTLGDSDGRIAFSPYGDYYYFGDSTEMLKMKLADDTPSADSPINPNTSGYHLTLPTMY